MPNKSFVLEDGLNITVFKRRGNRSIRLTISTDGKARVSIPAWAPYSAGINFAKSKRDWIEANSFHPVHLKNGQAIGKAHRLVFVASDEIKFPLSRLKQTEVIIKFPSNLEYTNEAVQLVARKACLRALRVQAESLLPQRLAMLASEHGFSYTKVSIRQLKGRWGSCDQHKNITLNLFLMQLPWQHIDYVIIHELVHTKVLKHGTEFWRSMEQILPNAKTQKKQLHNYQPTLVSS